ncbi:hypothetical protein GDO78_013455 [Eleutherodactylus coqui]|uniref:COMM domain-containing protein 5 n=1 Tax=Eleutherodactylus coqui TaxID=57060 RepID=A0A8J6F113_ELECQ|nr:hypothetical protein GDO78_013455 [Eleutherodactylus coqui]
MTSVRTVHPYPSSSSSAVSNDRSSYLGARIPPEVEGMARQLKELDKDVFRRILKEDFANIVYGSRRPVLEDAAIKQGIRLPTVEDMRWRVDVAISSSSLSRALQPSILMQMKLSNGESHRFEVPVAKFQELRYNIALLLKEMNDLEKKNILKIQD